MTAVTYSIVSGDAAFTRALARALKLETWRLRLGGGGSVALRKTAHANAHVAIYSFDRAQFAAGDFAERSIAAVRGDAAKVKIFLQLASAAVHGAEREDTDRINRTIEEMARACGGQTVFTADLMQTGRARRLKTSGKPNLYGYLALAHVIVRAIKARALRGTAVQKDASVTVPDAQTALAHLVWKHPHLPESLTGGYEWEFIEDVLDGRVSFISYPGWGKFPLGEPIQWAQAGANLSWQSYFLGLDFLRPLLAFNFDWANGSDKRSTAIIEKLRVHGSSPNDVLAHVGAIITDFVRNNPPEAPANERAYAEGTVSRRVKNLLMFLLCSAKAQRRDAAAIEDAWQNLTHALAMLESDEIYPKAGNHGVRQDALLMLVGLLFPQLDYAQRYARLGQERLEKHQLKRALSADGVWQENSFGYHLLVMMQLATLAADLRDAGAPQSGAIHDVLARMRTYAEALVKPDGTAPLLGDTAPRNAFSPLAYVQRELARAGGDAAPLDRKTFTRAKDTYGFPDAGCFVSHTSRTPSEDGSTVIFFANIATPKHKQSDDLSIVFSRGSHDLLVDGGTYNKEVSDTVRNAARFDPASHNTFRVNGAGYALRPLPGMKPAGLDGMWEGDGWAAARGFNSAYPDARISRLVIHLKEHRALIVLDRLTSKTSAAVTFEQFWHIHPGFTPPAGAGLPWTFTSEKHGHLLAAFDNGPGGLSIEHGGSDNPIAWLMLSEDEIVPTPYLRRMLRTNSGVMASLFQWSAAPAGTSVELKAASRDAIEIGARGNGFACRFVAGEKSLECLELTQRE